MNTEQENGQEPLIIFRNANIVNGEEVVVYDFNMEVMPSDFVYIVGKVGSGKTSIIRTITAENPLEKGKGMVCGYYLNTLKDKDIPFLRRKLGIVFQDFQLLMDRNVHDNLDFVLRATGWRDGNLILSRINEVLTAVGMTTKAHKMPHQLSGGEQQRIAIARAILNDPEIILADEPTGNLDGETADGIMKLFKAINAEKGTAVIIVTHNKSIVEDYPGRIFICKDEKCEEQTEETTFDLALSI